MIREAMRTEKVVGLARAVLFRRERVLKLEPRGKGIVATSLHFANEVHASDGYFAEIPDVELPKEMLELAKHIIDKMSGKFEPEQFEDRYENALIELIRSKQQGMPIKPQPTHRQTNVINLMDALRRSVEGETKGAPSRLAQKPESQEGGGQAARSQAAEGRAQGQDAHEEGRLTGWAAMATSALREYAKKRNFTRTAEPRGKLARKTRASVRRPQARRAPAALRSAPRARRRAQELGRDQGPEPVAQGQAAGGARRGPSARLRRVRGAHPRGRVRRRQRHRLGPRPSGRPRAIPHKGLAKGHLEFELKGTKLKGRWHLVHMKGRDKGGKENWLLIKAEDEYAQETGADGLLEGKPRSVKTGRTVEDVAGSDGEDQAEGRGQTPRRHRRSTEIDARCRGV